MTFSNRLASPWLDNLPYSWEIFNNEGTIHYFEKDNYIFHAGDRLDYVYVVLKGRIRTYLNTASGKEKTLMVIGKNGLLGEHFIQENYIHSASAIAVTESIVLKIEKSKFKHIAFSEQGILTQWLKMLSLKTEVLTQSYSNLFFNNSRKRLARSLIYLVEIYGEKITNNAVRIGITFTHQELGDFIGSSRVTVSNEMNQLQKEGIISKTDHYYHIQNVSKLKSIYNSDK